MTKTWATALNCGDREDVPASDYMIDSCWSYKNGDEGSEVAGCFHYASHVGYQYYMNPILIQFMLDHPKTLNKTESFD